MNDKWSKDGKRWHVRERDRIAERFRSHVRKPSNPRGRIIRENCFACRLEGIAKPGEAHHPDYTRPFLVAWVCYKHHRSADHGGLVIPRRELWDYSSLVAPLLKPGLEGNQNALSQRVEGVPF